jgi:hypothetical protein
VDEPPSRHAEGKRSGRTRLIGGVVGVVTLAAVVGIPLVLVTHRDFATVQSGTAVPIPSANASVRLALQPVSGSGQEDVQVTGLGFPANASVQVTASVPGTTVTGMVGQSTANSRGAFILSGRLPADIATRCASTPESCQFEGYPGIVLVTAASPDGSVQSMAAFQVRP